MLCPEGTSGGVGDEGEAVQLSLTSFDSNVHAAADMVNSNMTNSSNATGTGTQLVSINLGTPGGGGPKKEVR